MQARLSMPSVPSAPPPPAAPVSPLERRAARWRQRFDELRAFHQTHGHFQVPRSLNACAADRRLANWIVAQRTLKHYRRLLPEREQRLTALGFPWVVPKEVMEKWETRLAELVAFHQSHGHCRVPADWPNKKLWNWVNTQRFQQRTGLLSPERQRRLHTLNFFPSAKVTDPTEWHRRFAELAAFHQKYRHCNVPPKWTPNPALGQWAAQQLKDYLHNRLAPEYVERLATLRFFHPAGLGANYPR